MGSSLIDFLVHFPSTNILPPAMWDYCGAQIFPNLNFFFFFFFFFCIFRAAPAAYGGSQARGQIRAAAAGLHHSHSNAGSEPCVSSTYTITHGNARSLTHQARPGIEPATSWFLVGFAKHRATMGTPQTWILSLNHRTQNYLSNWFPRSSRMVHS